MYGIIVTLQPGRCLSQLLELRNEYRVKFAGQLPKVILSQADYDLLASEYPVRNYGNVVHGMSVIVLREWEAVPTYQLAIVDECSFADPVLESSLDVPATLQEDGTLAGIRYIKADITPPASKPPRKKPGRKPKGKK